MAKKRKNIVLMKCPICNKLVQTGDPPCNSDNMNALTNYDGLVEALVKYGVHGVNCQITTCTCGFEQTLKQAKENQNAV